MRVLVRLSKHGMKFMPNDFLGPSSPTQYHAKSILFFSLLLLSPTTVTRACEESHACMSGRSVLASLDTSAFSNSLPVFMFYSLFFSNSASDRYHQSLQYRISTKDCTLFSIAVVIELKLSYLPLREAGAGSLIVLSRSNNTYVQRICECSSDRGPFPASLCTSLHYHPLPAQKTCFAAPETQLKC